MATAVTLDVASLLTPASEAQPSGPELRYSSDKDKKLYYAVRDARKKAVDAERRERDFASMGDEDKKGQPGPPDPADWESVRRYSVEALTKSKDLWIAAWLIEALTRLHGFAGLREGVLLAHQLCESFWDDIHPQPNKEDGLQTRFAQLAGLDGGSSSEGTLIAPIMNLPITASDSTGHFSLADFKDASELERKDPSIRRRRVEEGAVTLDTFNQAVAETSVEFFLKLLDDLKGAGQAFADFTALLREKEEKYRADGGQPFLPPSSKIREVLDECLRQCRAMTKDILPKLGSQDEGLDSAEGSAGSSNQGADARSLASLSVETRQEAFQTLLRVSDYFRRTEPHSPISYALEQVVRWGNMSLPQLLAELVSDRSTREEIFRRAGIAEEPSEK